MFDVKPYLSLIRHDGALVTVGMLEPIHEEGVVFGAVSMSRITIAGSLIGSIAKTQACSTSPPSTASARRYR